MMGEDAQQNQIQRGAKDQQRLAGLNRRPSSTRMMKQHRIAAGQQGQQSRERNLEPPAPEELQSMLHSSSTHAIQVISQQPHGRKEVAVRNTRISPVSSLMVRG